MAHVPNLLSSIRLLLVPVMFSLAWSGSSRFFLFCLVLSTVTDCADGYLARRLNLTSELGARLDSWADMCTYLVMPVCAWWLRPDVIQQQGGLLAVGIFSYLAAIAFGFLKYHRLTSYHTWGAKLVAWVMGAAILIIFAGGPGWVLRIVVPVVVLSQIEEMAITALLPRWQANVPSLRHALRIKQGLAPAVDPSARA